jgi:DNA-binding NtrC family response regulator
LRLSNPCVLIVDDTAEALRQLRDTVAGLGFDTFSATSGEAALALLRGRARVDVLLLDLVMPDRDGLAVLETLAREGLAVPTIVTVERPEAATLAAAANAGAVDFVEKPATPMRLRFAIASALRQSRLEAALATRLRRRDGRPAFADFIAADPEAARARDIAIKAARGGLPLLIEGEAGSGRSFLATLVHANGDRRDRPLVSLAAPDADLDAAVAAAAGGTLLIEEIGDLPPSQQARLYALLDSTSAAGGPHAPRRGEFRLIATSRCRLLELARAGRFRENLYYRLNATPVTLPPLRQRPRDLVALADAFALRFAVETRRPVAGLSSEALALLAVYDWPENVRQLEGAIGRAVALARGRLLEPTDFPEILVARASRAAAATAIAEGAALSAPVHIDMAGAQMREPAAANPAPDRFLTDDRITRLADVERNLIAFALARFGGQMARTARALGIGRSTLYRKLREYGLADGIDADAA